MKKGSGLENIICVTNRHVAAEAAGISDADGDEGRAAFLAQLRRVAERKPKAVILREKDLAEEEYRALAKDVLAICHAAQVPCILHT
ncbi:MAG: thiamine phosphate synthase, partial [Veillonellaceae bacterium]|nr:thiamine phosphate synthase [Veillonellaceae bacterium]